MIALSRFRVLMFALVVLGSFASFAQNEWGNYMIVACEALIATSFFLESGILIFERMKNSNRAIINTLESGIFLLCVVFACFVLPGFHSVKGFFVFAASVIMVVGIAVPPLFVIIELVYSLILRKDKVVIPVVLSNYFLFLGFLGAVFKNMFWTGASIISFLSIVLLFLFYAISNSAFVIRNIRNGKTLSILLALCSFSLFLLGFSVLFKVQHWPYATILLYTGITITLIVLIVSARRKFRFHNESVGIIQGLKLLKYHFLLIYSIVIIFCSYITLVVAGIAPRYYSQHYPVIVYKTLDGNKASALANSYNNFVQHCEGAGFLK